MMNNQHYPSFMFAAYSAICVVVFVLAYLVSHSPSFSSPRMVDVAWVNLTVMFSPAFIAIFGWVMRNKASVTIKKITMPAWVFMLVASAAITFMIYTVANQIAWNIADGQNGVRVELMNAFYKTWFPYITLFIVVGTTRFMNHESKLKSAH